MPTTLRRITVKGDVKTTAAVENGRIPARHGGTPAAHSGTQQQQCTATAAAVHGSTRLYKAG